jgi:hypothetical protein
MEYNNKFPTFSRGDDIEEGKYHFKIFQKLILEMIGCARGAEVQFI